MPRRSPGEIRRELSRRAPVGRSPAITGLSGAADHQILAFERRHGLERGEVVRALNIRRQGLVPHPNGGLNAGDGTTTWRDMHARTLIEDVLHSLRRPARRQLARVLPPLDDQHLQNTVNDPRAPADLP